ncbi:single-stranded DNA-binding protein [Nocardioides sp. ChNu-153]|uniref:single-stranded DNA-binding protein n=1 Tax=unclassified Nocardioides TaxID=2615069 RepID=UPI002406B331|nr:MULTISPECIES: single-stranded DNA-binding protein [unclassified Nocardioides]MDF9716357.1 single-stranded DNA-binding protein [Nocardioides sp. ChNu-99]MDN7122863.1 single-stranded DNA-binding protein [Nocardioides sp. ChNu-153]
MSSTYITVQGWVGSDVNHSVSAGGTPVASFRLGSTPQRQARDGSWQSGETAWYTVKAWRHTADHVADSVLRGQPVVVTGRLVVETWERQEGGTATRHVIEATALGHDLTKGTARFHRSGPVRERPAPDVTTGAQSQVEPVAEPATGPTTEASERAA